MRAIGIYIIAILLTGSIWSCSEDDITGDSIFDTSEIERNEFEKWLLKNYTWPYNIDFKYRFENIESDMDYTLVPADIDKSIKLAKLVKYCWLEAYDEVAGIDFTRAYVPKIIHLVGSAAYNDDNTMVLGTAEGGLKITLYYVNSMMVDANFLNRYYFKTMHHEFAHILHQTKNYSTEFEQISVGKYIGDDWSYNSNTEARQAGFVSPYAQSEPNEDFVEIISIYVTNSPAYWDALLVDAGVEGAAIINEKFEIVRAYLEESWEIDINELRSVVQRRCGDLDKLDLESL
ncbi:MAG: putative zinc-binding metallopeptidase [Bacteroidales bacterium]|nr:putative zinc-binding metallopeptidase [Bacteroidales bacterium]